MTREHARLHMLLVQIRQGVVVVRYSVPIVIVAACVALFTIVSPATGGPSVSKVAKKALKLGKSADKRSKTASRQAKSASATARTAQSTATSAQSVASAGVRTTLVKSPTLIAAPNDFARFNVACPAGYVAMGHSLGLGALELVSVLNYGNGYLGSLFNPSTQSVFTGQVYVQCAQGTGGVAASRRVTKSDALRQVGQAEAARRAR